MDLPPENVQSYPRPPALEPVPHIIRIMLGGEAMVETSGALRVLETHHPPTYYIPPEDVSAELQPIPDGSLCEWKGQARYFDVTAGGTTASKAAWCYDRPSRPFQALAGFLAFYPGKMDACFVGDLPVIPQAGDFYGGWFTANLTGIPKGAPGTEYW